MTAPRQPAERAPGAVAHLLVQVEPGRRAEAVLVLQAAPGVMEAAATSGPYDVIALVREPLLQQALARVRRTPGLCAVRVCRPA